MIEEVPDVPIYESPPWENETCVCHEIVPGDEGVQEYVVVPDESVSDRDLTVVEPTISEPVTSAVVEVQELRESTENEKVIGWPTSYVECGTDPAALPVIHESKFGPTLLSHAEAVSDSLEPVCPGMG